MWVSSGAFTQIALVNNHNYIQSDMEVLTYSSISFVQVKNFHSDDLGVSVGEDRV